MSYDFGKYFGGTDEKNGYCPLPRRSIDILGLRVHGGQRPRKRSAHGGPFRACRNANSINGSNGIANRSADRVANRGSHCHART